MFSRFLFYVFGYRHLCTTPKGGQRRVSDPPRTGVTNAVALVLWKHSQCSSPLSYLFKLSFKYFSTIIDRKHWTFVYNRSAWKEEVKRERCKLNEAGWKESRLTGLLRGLTVMGSHDPGSPRGSIQYFFPGFLFFYPTLTDGRVIWGL